MNWLILLAALTQPMADTQLRTAPWIASRVDIRGDGFVGTDTTGPCVQFVGTGDGFMLGDGDAFRATGGRIEHIKIIRKGTGGTAIKLAATSNAFRPGQYVLRDLLILGDSDLHNSATVDNWETGISIDGGELKAVNAAGVRCIRLDNVRVAGCLGDSVRLRNVVHFYGTALQVDPGSAKRIPVVIIDGCQHVFLQANVFGEVHVRGSSVVRLDGYCQVLRVDAASADVVATGVIGKADVAAGAKRVTINGTTK